MRNSIIQTLVHKILTMRILTMHDSDSDTYTQDISHTRITAKFMMIRTYDTCTHIYHTQG